MESVSHQLISASEYVKKAIHTTDRINNILAPLFIVHIEQMDLFLIINCSNYFGRDQHDQQSCDNCERRKKRSIIDKSIFASKRVHTVNNNTISFLFHLFIHSIIYMTVWVSFSFKFLHTTYLLIIADDLNADNGYENWITIFFNCFFFHKNRMDAYSAKRNVGMILWLVVIYTLCFFFKSKIVERMSGFHEIIKLKNR